MKAPLPQRIGRYEVLDRLGEGGMGVVYLARDPVLDRTVAIKVLTVLDDEIKQRFGGEARSAARLTHPNIITIYDVGEDQSQSFIAMEYIDGETLSEVIRRRAPLRLIRRLELILELCAGLGHAHKMGIIHRDIKPANLMLTAAGVLKILDFGLARAVADAATSGLTRAGAMLGTPHYMSPEQAMGLPADHRSDIFAVGLVMYELLTWKKAFPGDSPHVVMHKIAHDSPRPIRQLFPMIDSELEEIVDTALDRDPDKRFQSLSAFATACTKAKDNIIALAESTTVRVKLPAPPIAPSESHDTASDSSNRADSGSAPERKTPVGGVRLPSREALARRRAEQIDRYVTEAWIHLQAGRYETAIEQCELALILDTTEARALETLHTAHAALEDQQIQHWLSDARSALSRGSLSAAEHLVARSLQARPDASEAQALQEEIAAQRDERRSARERARTIAAAVERQQRVRDETPRRREPVEDDPPEPTFVQPAAPPELIAQRNPRGRLEGDVRRRAAVVAMQARRQFVAGEHQAALATLHAFSPQELVAPVISELETELRRLKRRREETGIRARGTIDAPPPSPSRPELQPPVPREERPAPVYRPPVEPAAARPNPTPAKMPVPDTPPASLQVIALTWTNGAIAIGVLAVCIAVIAYSCG